MKVEPVAYINVAERKLEWAKVTEWHTPTVVNLEPIPLYTQQEWVGLTNDEIVKLWSWSMTAEAEQTATTQQHAFARAIEAKLKEKNT